MIDYSKIPQEEFDYIGNVSVFSYELGCKIFQNREDVWQRFLNSDFDEALQLLDNGTLIITQNLFGGQSIVSKFTCGLNFCYQLSKFLSNLGNIEQNFNVTLGADDCHSGWDFDFNLKIESNDSPTLKLIKDYDYRIEVDFDKMPFLKNYFEFSNKVAELFEVLYPDIVNHPQFKDLKRFNLKGSVL